jgi:hypothetical protein
LSDTLALLLGPPGQAAPGGLHLSISRRKHLLGAGVAVLVALELGLGPTQVARHDHNSTHATTAAAARAKTNPKTISTDTGTPPARETVNGRVAIKQSAIVSAQRLMFFLIALS